MSRPCGVQYGGGYHEYTGGYHEYSGGVQYEYTGDVQYTVVSIQIQLLSQ